MKVEIDLGILTLMLFLYILIVVVLLEIIYFESTLNEVIILLNNLQGN